MNIKKLDFQWFYMPYTYKTQLWGFRVNYYSYKMFSEDTIKENK